MSCIWISFKKLMKIANFFVKFTLVCMLKTNQQAKNPHKKNPNKTLQQNPQETAVSLQLHGVSIAGNANTGGFQLCCRPLPLRMRVGH